jgi:hypothetical protein
MAAGRISVIDSSDGEESDQEKPYLKDKERNPIGYYPSHHIGSERHIYQNYFQLGSKNTHVEIATWLCNPCRQSARSEKISD